MTTAAATSCPANRTITIVEAPIPQSFNLLSPSGDSTWAIGSLFDLSLAPFPLEPNGSLAWDQSLSNWITSNSNYTQWTFHIRPGATWSNGTGVNASDIADWLTPAYALNPQYDFVGLHAEVTGVQVVNSDTATVILNQSDAQLPNRIGTYYYAPLVSPTDVAKGPADSLFNPIGDGPWIPANYTSGSTTMMMLPNQHWPGVKPSACALDVVFVENSALMVPFLVSGQADFGGPLAFGNLGALQGLSNVHLHNFEGAYGSFIEYNVTLYPYNMTEFRQALAYSINSSAIVQQSLFGYGVPSNNAQGEVPSTYAAYNSNQAKYSYNISAAMNLLHSIGFTGGGSPSTPLKFPNGTQMSTTIFTDSSIAWDPDVAQQVAGFLQNLGINVQTQTLTQQNLQGDYVSNAFNMHNNLVLYSSSGPVYFSPWLDGQQGCNVVGIPGCAGWTATPSADGNTHWEYPPSADVQYQSNLTALDSTPPSNGTGQEHYLNSIESLNAQYLPLIMLAYPDEIYVYNTAHWVGWPSFYFRVIAMNVTMFVGLRPASSSPTTTTSTGVTTSPSGTGSSTSTSTPTGTGSSTSTSTPTGTITTHSITTTTTTSSPTTTSTSTGTNIGTIELIAGIVIVIIIIGGIAAYMMRRRPTS
ncbi:MAG: ABC transporter substrate-binding protein [Rhabdochlamydiaceae bacterium]